MKLIQYVLQTWAREQGCRGVSEAADKAGFKRSTFGYWFRGENVPKVRSQREKLYQLTKHPIFKGALTKELKALSLAEYKTENGMATCRERLSRLISAIIPDLQCVVNNGTVVDREHVRSSLSTTELVEFSTLARALSSEDAFNLLQKELKVMKGGKS